LRIFPYRKKVIEKNLQAVFPEMSKKERKIVRKKFYRFFTTLFVEGLKQITIKPENLKKRIHYSGFESIDELINKGQSCMLISYHYSNWEWGFVGYSVAAKHPLDGIYQPMSNEGFGDMIVESRSRFGANMIPMSETYTHLDEAKEKHPFVIGLIPDQTPIAEKGYWMEFLGRGTPVYRGPENLARKYDLPVFYVDIKSIKRGYYEAEVKLITDKPNEMPNGWITEQYMKKLELKIIENPSTYLWSHKRWKHTIPKDLAAKQVSTIFPPPEKDKIAY
jgi:KDO2-lipid IV(A) lauroyltransferase